MLSCLLALMAATAIAAPATNPRAIGAPGRDGRRILLLLESPADPLMGRIKAEIAALGLEILTRTAEGPLEASARAEHAVAAIRRLPSRKGVEVWMADETSGRSLLRQTVVDESPGGPSENLIALQTTELLRTSLFPHPGPKPASAAPTATNPDRSTVQTAPPPPSRESAVASGIGLLYGAGGAGPAWQGWLSYQHLWHRHLGLALHLGVPLRRGALSAREGWAGVGALVAGAEVVGRFESAGEHLFLTMGAGAGLAYVTAEGHPIDEASAQLVGQSSSASTGFAYVRVGAGYRLARWLRLGVSALGGTTVGAVRVRFAANDAGAWGVPLLGTALFGEFSWQ